MGQRMMLKYNTHRMVGNATQYKSELPYRGESVIGTANLIYDKFTEGGGRLRSDADLRYLLGLGHTWGNIIPEEFKPKQVPRAPRQRPSQPQQPQNNAVR